MIVYRRLLIYTLLSLILCLTIYGCDDKEISIENTETQIITDVSVPGIEITQRYITSYPSVVLSHQYTISPDGKKIAFIVQTDNETLQFVNTDGREGKR